MPFGLSFGASKTKGSGSTSVDKNVATNQATNSTKSSTGTTSNTGSQTGSTTQTGTQSSTQAGTTGQQTTGSQTQQQTTSQFSDSVLAGLESTVQSLFSTLPNKSDTTLKSNFDTDTYINAGMQAATQRTNQDLDASINGMFDSFGGRDDQNSMSMLLANRARADAGASLAGTRGQLAGQAEAINRDNFAANLQGQGSQNNFLQTILGALKGGQATTSGQVQNSEATSGQSNQTGTTNTSQAGTSQQNTQQTEVTQLAELLASIVAGNERTVGTEKTKSKGLTIGGGASASM